MRTHSSARRRINHVFREIIVGAALLISVRPALSEDQIHSMSRAPCGAGDRTESGLQGQTTLAERFSSGPTLAYNCNLELVGAFAGEGSGADVEAFDICAYYSTANNPALQHPGVTVLDVSNSRRPTIATYLSSPAMLDAHESLDIHVGRKLLIASRPGSTFDIYDLSADCRRPELKSSVSYPGLFSHAGQFSSDGNIYYGATWPPTVNGAVDSSVFALDVSDPSHPRIIDTWKPPQRNWTTHSVGVNKEGSRLYVSLKRMTDESVPGAGPNGLVILDASDVSNHRSGGQFRLISTLFWNDSHGAEGTTLAKIRGRPYLIFTDNSGTLATSHPCDLKNASGGFARIIDLQNEQLPRVASRLLLEVADPANCERIRYDAGAYGGFACSVDDPEDAKLAACGYFESGLRIFDIRDPGRPEEVAYYKPPALRTGHRPGSLFRALAPKDKPALDKTADAVIIAPLFRPNGEIWFTSADNGFQVVRFTDRFKSLRPELFRHRE
ncbi:LVIVD repeat-containing protein [Peristeroidobacter soli]|uniref:LVIVD repeat-containing protein n=1 Tax=Peristeroidobacter soli TaxID=2497877 RepID=UPI00101C9655|nr:hypothetical protein [Peristeroidobacter soli]